MSHSQDPPSYRDPPLHGSVTASSVTKINQVVHNLFSKASHIIAQSRMDMSPVLQKGTNVPRVNKWFNLDLEESENLRNDIKLWRTIDAFAISQGSNISSATPAEIPPLVIESYLNLQNLLPNQMVVLIDPATGKKWPTSKTNRRFEVVVERWVIELLPSNSLLADDDVTANKNSPSHHTVPLNIAEETLKTRMSSRANRLMNEQDVLIELPIVYKKSIILFRSLYTYCLLLPMSNLRHNLLDNKQTNPPIKIDCRVLDGSRPISSKGRVGLTKPIIETETEITSTEVDHDNSYSHTESWAFVPLETPVGLFRISVTTRKNCNFAVVNLDTTLNPHSPKVEQPGRHFNSCISYNPIIEQERKTNIGEENPETETVSSLSNKGLSMFQQTGRRFSLYSANNYDLNNPLVSDTMPSEIIKNRRKSSIDSATRASMTTITGESNQDDHWHSTATSSAIPVISHAFTIKKSPVPFIQPFKTPPLSASPLSFDQHQLNSSAAGQAADLGGSSRPSSVSRISSNSSLAALRAPNTRSLSNASVSESPHFRGISELSGHDSETSNTDINHPSNMADNTRNSPISRSGSISKYSSSFGSKASPNYNTGNIISRNSSFSGPRAKRSSFSSGMSSNIPLVTSTGTNTSLYGNATPDHIVKHQMGSSVGSSLEPGSGFLTRNSNHGGNYEDVESFVKRIDSIRDQSKGASSSSLLNISTNLESSPLRDSSLISPEFPNKDHHKSLSSPATGNTDSLMRYQQMRYNISELSESISSSASSISLSPHSDTSSVSSRPRLSSYPSNQVSFSGGGGGGNNNNNSLSAVYSTSSSPVGKLHGTSPHLLHTPVTPSRLSEEYRIPSGSSRTTSAVSLISKNDLESSNRESRNNFALNNSGRDRSDSISRVDDILDNRSRSRLRMPSTSPVIGFMSSGIGISVTSPSSLPSYSRRPSIEHIHTNATSSPLDIPSTPNFINGPPQLTKQGGSVLISKTDNDSKSDISNGDNAIKYLGGREGAISKISALSTSISQYRPQYNAHQQLLTADNGGGSISSTATKSIDIDNYYRNNSFVSLRMPSRPSLPLSPTSCPVSTGVTPSSGVGEFIGSKKFAYYMNDSKESNHSVEDLDSHDNGNDGNNSTDPHDGFMPNITDDDDLLFAMSDMGLSNIIPDDATTNSLNNYHNNPYNHSSSPNYGWKRGGYSLDP